MKGSLSRKKIVIRGAVQGVGFRPFVYRLALELKLTGTVLNSSQGVIVEIEGETGNLSSFLKRLQTEKPPRSFFQGLETTELDPAGFRDFRILPSLSGDKVALVLPDIATCRECLEEILNRSNRRYRYPFTNCTNCGPRFSILRSLPYDRPNTAMRDFQMCETCLREYRDPLNRRFHAQPNACPECGPQLELWDAAGAVLLRQDDALRQAADWIRGGRIIAMKGLGGFHLIVDARNGGAVEQLRSRKRREEKPFAVMYPDLQQVRRDCSLSSLESRLLHSPEAPIVLLSRLADGFQDGSPAATIAPGNPNLGVMLPYTPLHHLLLSDLGFPVVATSGNLSDEPICISNREALERLDGIADAFLVHDRPIERHVDDSIVRVVMGRELVLRRARGYAPLPLNVHRETQPVLAVGAHLKNTVSISVGDNIFTSQHIGDLETEEAFRAFTSVIESLENLYDFQPRIVACDLHPDYLSSQHARRLGLPIVAVQHHYAHVLACMAENELSPPVLGVSWDGTGYGLDGKIWGGEFLTVSEDGFDRYAHFRYFPLPGGDKAVREPRRTALGLLFRMLGREALERSELGCVRAFSSQELTVAAEMLEKQVNCPECSSVGRLFDAVSSLADLQQVCRFEGQAAMALEFAIREPDCEECYPFAISRTDQGLPITLDWEPLFAAILHDLEKEVHLSRVAVRFHNTLCETVVRVALAAEYEKVLLTGGCFQNRYLLEKAVFRLRSAGFRPYWHQRIPPNDAGISTGQVLAVRRNKGED